MDNETPQPTEPTSNNQVPPAPGFVKGMRVVQPLDPDLKVDTTPTLPPAQSVSTVPSTLQQGEATNANTQATDTTTQTPQPVANLSSIYPEATHGPSATNYQRSSPDDNKKDTNESYSFSNGYSIGGSIFWFQLLAGIVLGLILYGITYSVLKSTNTSVRSIVSLLDYALDLVVGFYIPYNVLKSNALEDPFWLALFGVATQLIVVISLVEVVSWLIIRTIINHGVPSSLIHTGGSGLGVTILLVYIGFLVVAYFLTKLAYGLAFMGYGKINNKVIIKAVGIGVIAIVVGSMAYSTLHSAAGSALEGSVIEHGYATHKVTVGGHTFTVSFDRSAEVRQVDANNVIMSGNELNGSKVLVQLVDLSAVTTVTSGSCNNAIEDYTVLRNVNILGTSYPLCGSDADPSDENAQANTDVATVFQTKGQYYKLVFAMTSVSQSVDTNTAVQVAQSISN